MNYIIGIILILCGIFIMVIFPQKRVIDYVTQREVKFEREGAKVIMNMPEDVKIERVDILYHSKVAPNHN